MKQQKYIYSIRAILLALVFTAPLLVKPLHFVFVHHNAPHKLITSKATISEKEQDCTYCDFHFSSFITGINFFNPESFTVHFYKAATIYTNCIIYCSIKKLYAGRGPPM